jgi:hypothetical protein
VNRNHLVFIVAAVVFFASMEMVSHCETRTSLAVTVSKHVGSAPLKLDVAVRFDEQEFRGAAGCLDVDGPVSSESCWSDQDGYDRSPILRRLLLSEPGDYEVWAVLGRVASAHQAVRVN